MSAEGGSFGRREVAYRLFAVEYDAADLEYSDSDEERAPNYVVTPTGARVNRLFVVGVLTEVEPVSDDVLRARVVDPTGAFVAYGGQYQPEAVAFLEDAEVPSFVSLTGKARTFQPEGSDRVFTSVRPESLTAVDARTRDRWTVQAAEHTLARVATMARALEHDERGDALTEALREAGVEPGLASGVALAIDHYGTTPAYLAALREQAIAAAAVVTGDREAVPDLELAPDDEGPVEAELTAAPAVVGTLAADAELSAPSVPAEASSPEPTVDEPAPEPASETVEAASESDPVDEPPSEPEPTPEAEATIEAAGDDLGDFEGPGGSADDAEAEPTSERYEMGDDEREEVEAEFGTEFSTGSEVGEPGEAGIEPETEPPATDEPETEPRATESDVDAEPDEEPVAEPEPVPDERPEAQPPDESAEADSAAEEAPADVDLEEATIEAMVELDDGDGADHDAVVDAVVEAHGVDAGAVETAIDEALMDGRCYEPSDGRLKAI